MALTATTAELSRITSNGKRQACLTVDFSDGTFAGCLIEVGGQYGCACPTEEKVRGWLLRNAQERCDFECKTKGAQPISVKWEA